MVLKKFGFKSGSWLLNVEPKSKSESTKDSKVSGPRSGKSSLSILEEDFIKGQPPSQNDPYSLQSPASPAASPPVSNDSIRQSRRQSTLPTAKALFKMFASGSKKDAKNESGQDLRRAALSVSTSQLDSSTKHQSSSSLVAPSFTSQYYSPKSDKDTSGTTFETLPEHSTIESLSSPTSPASVKPFTKAESASYTISSIEGHSRPRALSSIEVTESPSISPRPNGIVYDRSKSLYAPGDSSFLSSKPSYSSHHRTASVGPSPLKTKKSIPEVVQVSRSDSTSKKLSRHSSTLSNADSRNSKPKSILVEELASSSRAEVDLLTSKLAEIEKDRDSQQVIIDQLKAEVSRGEQALEAERFSARQELEALLELQQQFQVSQRTVREGEAMRKTLESKLDELQNQLQAARDELGGLRHQNQSREELLSERVQLRSWLNEEKVRHNEVREEYSETKSKLKANLSRMNHLEALIQDQTERIKNYEIREAAANESSMKEVIYYQEQLAEAIRARDEIREENERNKEQIRVLRNTMEQLLKAGVAAEPNRGSSPALSFVHDRYSSPNPQELRSVKDSGHSASCHSQSNPSVYNEEIETPNPEVLNYGQSRHGLGSDRRRTFGLDSQVSGSAPLSPIYLSREISLISPKESSSEFASANSPSINENTTEFWDAKLKTLLKEKERTELEYSRIPTKVNKSMRLRKEELENLLDQLDSDISGARSRIRTLVI